MQTIQLGQSRLQCSRMAYGCWRIAGTWNPADVTERNFQGARDAVVAAHEAGYTLFDHADIYCHGKAEELFGKVLKEMPGMRDRILLATKCGIRAKDSPSPGTPYRYDFRAHYIVESCEGSLKRLGVETVDLYQLHRPDYLMNPDEVATAFDSLHRSGKVREFGVSNFRPSQVEALQSRLPQLLHVNQVEISLAHLDPLEDGTLDQCLTRRMTPMAWSPLGGGHLADGPHRVLPSQEGYRSDALLAALDALAREKQTTRAEVALAWLLRHPAGIVPIIGSTHPGRIRDAARVKADLLTHEEWYALLAVARARPLP